jgi:hypothetical protein
MTHTLNSNTHASAMELKMIHDICTQNYLYPLFMIYVLKIIWDYWVSLLELIVRNIARYPQFATSTPIRCHPAVRYLVPCLYPKIAHVMRTPGQDKEPLGASSTKNQRDLPATTPIQDTHSRWLGVWEYAVYIWWWYGVHRISRDCLTRTRSPQQEEAQARPSAETVAAL